MIADVFAGTAMVCAFAVGGIVGYGWFDRKEVVRRKRATLQAMGRASLLESMGVSLDSRGLAVWVIEQMVSLSGSIDETGSALGRLAARDFGRSRDLIAKAGLESVLTRSGFVLARLRLAGIAGLAGALIGCLFSPLLMCIGLAAGMLMGWSAPIRALKEESRSRSFSADHQLSQMIEVVVLGLKSGMSFDRSLLLYCDSFGGSLSAALASAQRQWSHSLISRAEGLRGIARSYDSQLFDRFAENVIRSLRFGTSLADNLGLLAVEARSARKAKLEEQVAKAPVKMLLPVGALILPAMLILIMGPIMLDLMKDF